MQHDKIDEILEQLWILIVEEKNQEISPELLTEKPDESVLKELQDNGWILLLQGRLSLTESGYQQAQQMIRRHRLAERLFVDILDTKGGLLEEAACHTEHILKEGIDEKICTLLGHPKTCPHGRPIPSGDCCLKAEATGERLVDTLANLKPNQQGRIAYLQTKDAKKTHKLMAMGVLPGTLIKLLRRFPSYVFTIGYSQFAIDREMAEQIFVRVAESVGE